MKKLLLLLLLCQFSLIKAQVPFPDSAAIWVNANYNYIWSGSGQIYFPVLDNVKNYCVNGSDTLINSIFYTKLFKCGNGLYRGGLRDNNNGKVYFVPKDSTKEFILYDFTLKVGDSVDFFIETPQGNDWIQYNYPVSHASTITVNGITRRTIGFGSNNHGWIEGIGCDQGLLADPWPNVSMYQRELHCMSLNDSILFQYGQGILSPSIFGPCDLTLAINESNKDGIPFLAFPNPTTGKFILNSYKTTVSYFEVMNVLGKLVLKSQITNDNTTIDLSAYDNGIYFIKVTDDKGVSTTQKIIKQ